MCVVKQNKKESKYKKLGSSRILFTVLACFFVVVIADIFIIFFASSFASYMMDSKLADEYEVISYMAKIYDNTEDEREAVDILKKYGRTFFVTDKHGAELHGFGENTIGSTSGKIEIPVFEDKNGSSEEVVKVYVDKVTEGFLEPDEDGEIEIKFGKVIDFAMNIDKETSLQFDKNKTSVEMPIWLAIDVKGGKQTLFAKAGFSVSLSDISFIVIFSLAGVALVVCIIALMLINMISMAVGQRKMIRLFFDDHVTGGRNWMWFLYKSEQILKKRKYAALKFAVLDVVIVKYRNYCVCHSVNEGEEMLIGVYKVLRQNVGKNELVAHYAAASFALMLTYKSEEELKERMENIIVQLRQTEDDHRMSFHVGIYPIGYNKDKNGKIIKRKNIDIERDYNNACTARATIVEDDSEIAFFDEKLVDEQRWIDKVLDKYEDALENDEFVIYYQPKYDPKSEKLRGVEALIRWDSPELGFIYPGKFIPILEKNGAIPDIDHYMIEHVAMDQKAWLDAGLKCVPASVNVSRAHFIERDLAEQIRDAVDAKGAPRELIEIELTESAFFDDKKVMIETIKKLKEYGFQVSMDDFGSGYSSLNSLKDMPLDVLKLDAEFFRGDLNDNRGEIVVSEAIKIAKNLDMLTVAEGVEAKEQVDFLAKQGCDMIQGYYYAKPMPKAEYETKMEKIDTYEEVSVETPGKEEQNDQANEQNDQANEQNDHHENRKLELQHNQS